MHKLVSVSALGCAGFLFCFSAIAQLDPEKRELIQLGYNQPLEGRGPIGGYAFYYYNKPGFLETNLTLRAAVAPVYMDSELGFRGLLGQNTDLGLGISGGGYANSYYEIRDGKYYREESFTGHGAEVPLSVYHLFNPGQMIPLNGVFRVSPGYTVYERDGKTSPYFQLPDDHASLNYRAGLRWGGQEPVIQPDMAMELSAWYEGKVRDKSGEYGYNGDREMEEVAHLFWTRALIAYTLTNSQQSFCASMTAGTSVEGDRLSAYRLGGDLPLSSEFPLILPGYYFQEISARQFVNLTGQYSVPIDPSKRLSVTGIGSMAFVDYTPGTGQSGNFHSGVGVGLGYRSHSGIWRIMGSYGYGFQASRSHGCGGHCVGFLCQVDLEARHRNKLLLDNDSQLKSGGLSRFFHELF